MIGERRVTQRLAVISKVLQACMRSVVRRIRALEVEERASWNDKLHAMWWNTRWSMNTFYTKREKRRKLIVG